MSDSTRALTGWGEISIEEDIPTGGVAEVLAECNSLY
jgi:hypothetical protein